MGIKIYLFRKRALGDVIMCTMPMAEHFLEKGKNVTIFTSKGFRSLRDNHTAKGLKISSKDSIWLRIVKLVFKKQYF